MNAQDPVDAGLAEAMAMIDARSWGARLRVVATIRQLEKNSPDGWARVSYRAIAARVKISPRYASDLMSAKAGSMWRTERVLVRGEPGIGTRPTAYRINPRADQWRGVPWLESDRETRRLRLEGAWRAVRRGTDEGLVPGSHVAALADLAPRSHVAAQESLVPRSMSRHKGPVSAATWHRGTSVAESGTSSFCPVGADAPPTAEEEKEGSDLIEELRLAILARSGKWTHGSLVAQLGRLADTVPADALMAAIAAAPTDLGPPKIIREWIPMVLRRGGPPGARPAPAHDPRHHELMVAKGELEVIEQRISVYADRGEDPPPSLLAQRAACENELDHLLAGANQ